MKFGDGAPKQVQRSLILNVIILLHKNWNRKNNESKKTLKLEQKGQLELK